MDILEFEPFIDPPDGIFRSYYGEMLYSVVSHPGKSIRDVRIDLAQRLVPRRYLSPWVKERMANAYHQHARRYLDNLAGALERDRPDYHLSGTEVPVMVRCRAGLWTPRALYPYIQQADARELVDYRFIRVIRGEFTLTNQNLGPTVAQGYLPYSVQGRDRYRFIGWPTLEIPDGKLRNGRLAFLDAGDILAAQNVSGGKNPYLARLRKEACRLAQELVARPVIAMMSKAENGEVVHYDRGREIMQEKLIRTLRLIEEETETPQLFLPRS